MSPDVVLLHFCDLSRRDIDQKLFSWTFVTLWTLPFFGLFSGHFAWLATSKKFLFPDGTGFEWIETVVRLLAQLTLNVS